jgi:hypothetical protein
MYGHWSDHQQRENSDDTGKYGRIARLIHQVKSSEKHAVRGQTHCQRCHQAQVLPHGSSFLSFQVRSSRVFLKLECARNGLETVSTLSDHPFDVRVC